MDINNKTKQLSISKGLVFLMAITSGFIAANIYLNQTLLVSMGQTFT
ncbi:hypothetical protein QKW52_18160 [Bacillus sonorensis]|nr:hypothetical protein [Bacillus sonorensis]